MKQASVITLLGTLATALLFSLPAQAAYKCWTNNEGVTECGEKVPPEFAQGESRAVSESGMVLEEQARAKTPEEVAAEERAAAEAAEAARIVAEAKKQDNILLATFSTVAEIERVRDDKIAALEAQIGVSNKSSEKIQANLSKRKEAAAAQELSGNPPNEDILAEIESLERQLANNESFIVARRAEQEQVKEEYAQKIARFEELKGLN